MNSAAMAERKASMRPLDRSGTGAGAPSPHFTILLHQTTGLPIALPEKPSAAFLMVTHLDDKWLFLPASQSRITLTKICILLSLW